MVGIKKRVVALVKAKPEEQVSRGACVRDAVALIYLNYSFTGD